ncbi:MAG: OmpA family protein [Bacteroidales bacterium]|jgi:outer membrane protein OmpA-like peptidoglycan-associated protein|nr:OmpA family protein [Bacteroidales bacterium]
MKKVFLTLMAGLLWSFCFSQTTGSITSKFDFVPGEKIIFFDDFSSENIGDFPLQWLTNGSGEIVTLDQYEGRWFQITQSGYYIPEVKDPFTDNYTIEFDLYILSDLGSQIPAVVDLYFLSGELANPSLGSQPGQAGLKIQPAYESLIWNNWSEAREWQGDEGQVNFAFKAMEKYHISFWVQKQRVRMYANDQKILDLPRGLQANYTYNIFRIDDNSDETTPLISNFRMAAGMPDMRNKLITEGKLVSYGIYFDVNSDRLKPESTPSIKEIASVLKDNPDIKVKIVGHTDSDGADDLNLGLSKRRAESVKNELVKAYSIDAGRLESEGKGETQPLAPNDNALNKSKNRRVEFITL